MLAKLFWANMFLKIVDLVTTVYLINRFGYIVEANPIMRNMFNIYGTTLTCVLSMSIYVFLVGALYHFKQRRLLKICFVLMLFVAINNLFAIFLG
jgi:hypothetical protein